MAKLVLTNPQITIGGVDLSNSISSVTLDTKYDIVETTAFGDSAKKLPKKMIKKFLLVVVSKQ